MIFFWKFDFKCKLFVVVCYCVVCFDDCEWLCVCVVCVVECCECDCCCC